MYLINPRVSKTVLRFMVFMIVLTMIDGCVFLVRKRYTYPHVKKEYVFDVDCDMVVGQIKRNVAALHIGGEWIEDSCDLGRQYRFLSDWRQENMLEHKIDLYFKQEYAGSYTIMIVNHNVREQNSITIDPFYSDENIDESMEHDLVMVRERSGIPENMDSLIASFLEDHIVSIRDISSDSFRSNNNKKPNEKNLGILTFGKKTSSGDCDYAHEICDKADKVYNVLKQNKKEYTLSYIERINLEAKFEALSIQCAEESIKCK